MVTRSLDSFIYIYIDTLGGETYQSGIYFPVGDLCQADPPLVPHVRNEGVTLPLRDRGIPIYNA